MAEDALAVLEREAIEVEARLGTAREAIRADEERLSGLRAATEALNGGATRSSTRSAAPASRTRRRTRLTTSRLDDRKVMKHVRQHPVGAADIGKHVGACGNPLTLKAARDG